MKMSVVLALVFLISTLVQWEDRLQALGLGCTSKAAHCSQVLWCLLVCKSPGRSSRTEVRISVRLQQGGRPRRAVKSRKSSR